jgi:hypothetical protein
MWEPAIPVASQPEAEEQLWRAVIVTAIEEWLGGPLSRRREAEQYLFNDQKDFPLVCRSAGIDAKAFRVRLAQMRADTRPRPKRETQPCAIVFPAGAIPRIG